MSPVRAEERILLLDVLRGLAMFGVLWSNLNDWYGAADPVNSFQHALRFAQDWLIESRFYSLLGFLFGMGFAIQLTRAGERGRDVRPMFLCRMLALLAIGIIHGLLIWQGDILTTYALLGMLLVFFRRFSPRRLLVSAAACLLVVPYAVNLAVVALHWKFPIRAPQEQIDQVYAHGTLAQTVAMGAHQYLFWYSRWPLFVFPPFLALFLLGIWAVRTGAVQRSTARRGNLVRLLAFAIAGALAGAYIETHLAQWWPLRKDPMPLADAAFSLRALQAVLTRLPWNFLCWCNSIVYACLMALILSVPAGARRLGPVAAVGRMSLTTYLTQSVVCVCLFYGFGFGWYGRVGYDGMLAITLVLFGLQMAASNWWLRRYRFGPMEWLWRSAAYGKRQPMRIVVDGRDAEAATA